MRQTARRGREYAWLELGLAVLLTATSTACAARGGVPRPFPGAELPPGAAAEPRRGNGAGPDSPSNIVTKALEFRGVPYRDGGSDPAGFDCSGFVQYVFRQLGLVLPRDVSAQYHVGRKIKLRDVQPGDLVFFHTVSHGASHVGLAIGGDQFVHAPSARGVVRIERWTAAYWATRFVGARRPEEVSRR